MKVTIHIHSAKGLEGVDLLGKSDPYTVVTLTKHLAKTKIKMFTLRPVWEEKFEFAGGFNLRDKLVFKVYDWNKYTEDVLLGSAVVGLKDLFDGGRKYNTKLHNLKGLGHLQFKLFCEGFNEERRKLEEHEKEKQKKKEDGYKEQISKLKTNIEELETENLKKEKKSTGSRFAQMFSAMRKKMSEKEEELKKHKLELETTVSTLQETKKVNVEFAEKIGEIESHKKVIEKKVEDLHETLKEENSKNQLLKETHDDTIDKFNKFKINSETILLSKQEKLQQIKNTLLQLEQQLKEKSEKISHLEEYKHLHAKEVKKSLELKEQLNEKNEKISKLVKLARNLKERGLFSYLCCCFKTKVEEEEFLLKGTNV